MSKRKAAEKIIFELMADVDKITKAGNLERYKRAISDLSDAQFDKYMKAIRDGKGCLYIYNPNLKEAPKMDSVLALAKKYKVNLFQRLYLRDEHSGDSYLTPSKFLVLKLPMRRMVQYGDHKIAIPKNDNKIDALTGQVTHESRAAGITTPEIASLDTKGLKITSREFVSVRGGNIPAYQAGVKKQGEETGEVRLEHIDPDTKSRVAVVMATKLESMHLKNTVVSDGDI